MAVSTSTATRPRFTVQPSLLGGGDPSFDPSFTGLNRIDLGAGAWVDTLAGWLDGHQTLFDRLVDAVRWEQHQRPMYERIVDVPRLTGSPAGSADSGGDGLSVIAEMGAALGRRYEATFERVGYALYRDGRDSVAWHGDQVARDLHQAIVATVSVGEPRKFCLRPKGGGSSRSMQLGHGDLVVMGGTCQRTWDHGVPKVASAGPRIAVMFRPVWPVG